MCSGYDQSTPNEARNLNIANILHWMETSLGDGHRVKGVHPRGKGLVVANGKTGLPTAVVMHWGVFKSGIVLPTFAARTESPRAATWARVRRCVIPVDKFYSSDWQGVPWSFWSYKTMWLAAVWEQHPEHGLCYALVSKLAERPVLQVDDRMPCCLTDDEALDYLNLQRPAARVTTVSLHGLPTEGKKRR